MTTSLLYYCYYMYENVQLNGFFWEETHLHFDTFERNFPTPSTPFHYFPLEYSYSSFEFQLTSNQRFTLYRHAKNRERKGAQFLHCSQKYHNFPLE